MKTGLSRAALAFALALTCAAGAVRAQVAGYPDRPIKLLVGFGAGGGTDIVARILAPKMSESLGQSVVVENRTGASGMIAAADVAKSPPDGGVTLTGASPLVLVANPAFAAHTVADVIAMAKANPGKINFGTGGVGTTPHMTAELFEHDAGIRMVHVAYRGEAPAITDTVAGQIPLMFANLSAVTGHLKGGTLRGIGVTSAQRAATAPDVPTVAETIPGFAAESWFGIVAPAGTPRDILERLNAAVRQALAAPDTRARLAQLGMSNNSSSPEEFDAYIKSEIARWGQVIEDAHIEAAN